MAKAYSGEYQHFIRKAQPSDLYPNAYNLALIESIDDLQRILSQDTNFISFDTETNGLDPEQHHIVGYSFCMDGKNAYYVAVNHKVGTSNLGLQALDMIYNKMCQTQTVLMFNMRFDCRMMEYTGFDDDPLPLDERWKKSHFRYDMTKVNVMDIQALVYLADTNKKYPSLKWSEEWFLGWRGASFEDTLGEAENFEYLDPKECYKYAATDALGTYLLFPKVYPFYQEARISGQLDNNCLMPLMRYEEETIQLDVDMLKSYSQGIDAELEQVQQECWAIVGFPFNLGSPKEKSQIFDRLGISTGEKNSRGEWKSGEDDIDVALSTMEKDDPNYRLLSNLVKFAHLRKQKTSYVDNIIDMANNQYHPNRLRFSYKTTEVPSGRLAAGGDKKNPYFASLNIQNIPKPHVEMWYYITVKEALQHMPDLFDHMFEEKDGKKVEKREWKYTKRTLTSDGVDKEVNYTMTRILDWVFADHPFEIEGVQEYIVEGFRQDRNIRSCFMPDEGRYWVSIDYAAEELRIAALISGEPVWQTVFATGGDVHESTAKAIWGEENYNRDLRKLAKGANFGILYGQNEYNFAEKFDGDINKSRAFLEQYKGSLPTLFRWVNAHQRISQQRGMVNTYFGRPIRTKSYFDSGDYKKAAYARRLSVNATIQGTGADILKITFLKLWKQIFSNEENRNKVKFCSTIHDEINYQITKEDTKTIVPLLIKTMRMQLPGWKFPIDVGLSIGNRWGMDFDFVFDPNTFEILHPKGDPYNPEKKVKIVENTNHQTWEDKETEVEYEMPTIEF